MGCLCNTSLSIKLPSPLQGKVKWISTNHNATPALSQGPLLLLISPTQHGHQSPKSNFGQPGAPVASWSRGPWISSVPAGALLYRGGSAGGREPSQTPHPPASAWPVPQQRPVGALLGTAPVPCHSVCPAMQGGRHPQLSSPSPLGHNCSPTGAKEQPKCSLPQHHPSPCSLSILLLQTGLGARNNPRPYSRA